MEEKWLPAEHTLTWRVEVNLDEAVILVRGKSYGVRKVELTYRRVADEVNEWKEPEVVLRTSGLRYLERAQLDEVPLWLAEIEARAQPVNP